jgi:hypothetical protein
MAAVGVKQAREVSAMFVYSVCSAAGIAVKFLKKMADNFSDWAEISPLILSII